MELCINSFTFTGEIEDIIGVKDEKYLLVRSQVSENYGAEYPLVIKNADFEKLKLKPKQHISALNVPLGIENGRYRFRMVNSSQVWRIAPRNGDESFSRATFSGIISGIDDTKDAYILRIVQEIGNRKAEFFLVVGKKLYPNIPAVNFDDEVLVSNAQAYQKDGIFRFRITSGHQLKLIKRNNPDKGVVQARDKFI